VLSPDGVKLLRDPGGIRTHDPQLRRLLLYPTELLDRISSRYLLMSSTMQVYGGLYRSLNGAAKLLKYNFLTKKHRLFAEILTLPSICSGFHAHLNLAFTSKFNTS
jgi:hypothetical protein